MNEYIKLGAVAFIGGLIAGGLLLTFIPKSETVYQQVAGSPVGSTFGTAKIAEVEMTPATASATSTFILNSDASDRYIESSNVVCSGVGTSLTAYTGAGLAALLVQMATSSATTAGPIGNSNYASNITVSTSTVVSYNASTTEGVIAGTSRRWPAGAYLGIFWNATNTAACVVGVHYLAS